MQVVFFGSPAFAVPSLEALVASRHRVLAAVTRADRPRGRGLASAPSAVAGRALALGLPVLRPERLDAELLARVSGLAPDVLAVVAYGRILPPALLALAPRGAVNVHASLLPRHRGASPVQAALLAGDAETGVATMLLDEGLDTGPVLLERRTPVAPGDDLGALSARLAGMGAALLVETLDRLEQGGLEPRPQPAQGATYAPRLRAQDARVDWSRPAVEVERQVRAFAPAPGSWTRLPDGRRLKLIRARVGGGGEAAGGTGAPPGRVVAAGPGGVEVACGEGRLVVLAAQPEGRRAQSAAELVNGRQLRAGDQLGG